MGGRGVQLKVDSIILADKLELVQIFESGLDHGIPVKVPGSDPAQLATSFFKSCDGLIVDCDGENLPKFSVEARLHYSKIAYLYQSYTFATKSLSKDRAAGYVKRAKIFLEEAKKLCASGFQNAESLQRAVDEALGLLGKEWYEPVDEKELASIKAAMVSGLDGLLRTLVIATIARTVTRLQ